MADSRDLQSGPEATSAGNDNVRIEIEIDEDFDQRIIVTGPPEKAVKAASDVAIRIMNANRAGTNRWLYVSAIGFLVALAALILLIKIADRTTLPDGLYYLILIPLGASAAAFLFGAMRAYAKYSGKVVGGELELGGPAVVFFLILGLGFYANRETDFGLTIRVHGPAGPSDVIRKGRVTIYLGTVQRSSDIRSDGEAIFNGVPSIYMGERIRVTADVDSFVMGSQDSVMLPPSRVVELRLERRKYETRVRGSVQSQGGDPISGATIDINSGQDTTRSDAAGNFSLVLPMAPGTVVRIVVRRAGFQTHDYPYTVSDAEPLRVVLRRRR